MSQVYRISSLWQIKKSAEKIYRSVIVIVRSDQVQFVNLFAYFSFDVLKLQDLQIVLSLGKSVVEFVESTLFNFNLWWQRLG